MAAVERPRRFPTSLVVLGVVVLSGFLFVGWVKDLIPGFGNPFGTETVDRSAAYAARYVAKNVVAAGLADRCQIQVAYAIGVAHPLSVLVDTFGTEADGLTQDRIEQLVREHFDLRPAAILRDLDLRRPIYEKTAAYGHFGRDDRDFTWERTDKAVALRQAAGISQPATV